MHTRSNDAQKKRQRDSQQKLQELIAISRSLVEKMGEEKARLDQAYVTRWADEQRASVSRYLELNKTAQKVFAEVREVQTAMAEASLELNRRPGSQLKSA